MYQDEIKNAVPDASQRQPSKKVESSEESDSDESEESDSDEDEKDNKVSSFGYLQSFCICVALLPCPELIL